MAIADPNPDPHSSEGYERSDARLGPILKFVVWLFVGSGLIMVAMWLLLLAYKKMPLPNDDIAPHPLSVERQIPSEPRLEMQKGIHKSVGGELIDPTEASYFNTKTAPEWTRQWTETLESYGWIDPDPRNGLVHVPIERAMEMKLQKGFPVTQKPGN